MKLYFDKRSEDPTYYARESFWDGKKRITRNVRNFGKHSELLKITDDPEAYVREEIREMNEVTPQGKDPNKITIYLDDHLDVDRKVGNEPVCINIGYFILQFILKELQLKKFFKKKTAGRKLTFDCYTIARFLTYIRVLNLNSTRTFPMQLATYYERPKFTEQDAFHFMELLEENYYDYLEWLYRRRESVVPSDTTVLYYGCLDFSLKCKEPGDDYIDEVTGETLAELRQHGMCWYEQDQLESSKHLIDMGIILDGQGMPVTMCLHSSNRSDQTATIPPETEVSKMLGGAKLINCADGGDDSLFSRLGSRSFVVNQTVKKLSPSLQDIVFDDQGYRMLSSDAEIRLDKLKKSEVLLEDKLCPDRDLAYKVIMVDNAVDLGLPKAPPQEDDSVRGGKATDQLKQRVIITFSRKLMESQRTARHEQIKRGQKLLNSSDPKEVKKGVNKLRGLLKKITELDGKKKSDCRYVLDAEKVANAEKYDGFNAVVTNLDGSASDVLEVLRNKSQMQIHFRNAQKLFTEMITNHHDPSHLKANFLICYTAFLVIRLLEDRLSGDDKKLKTDYLITTMKRMCVSEMYGVVYQAIYGGSWSLEAMNNLSKLNLDMVYYFPEDLDKKIRGLLE